jgi:tetratricopeptide (TPR) repeat protein
VAKLRAALAVGVILAFSGGASVTRAAETNSVCSTDKRWEQPCKDLRQGKAAEAKAGFEELIRQYPNEADLHLFLGLSLLRLRDPQAAILAIKRAIGINPNHSEAHTLLGYVELEVRGDVDAAIKEYQKVIELRPNVPQAYSNLAVAQKKKGQLDAAIATLNKALEIKPDYADAITTRGGIYAEQWKWSEARRDFEQALKLNPNDDGALYGLSQAMREAREYAGAQGHLSELISRSGNFVYWLEWGRVVMIRFWWVLLLIALGWAFKGKILKARTEANG